VPGLLCGLAVTSAFVCTAGMNRPCNATTPCIAGVNASLFLIALIPVAILIASCIVRAAWLLAQASRNLLRLPHTDWPSALREAVREAGIERIHCVAGSANVAFCAGAIHPTVYITRDVVERLRPDELAAVLLHEGHHCRRRDPLRLALRSAAADIAFFLPLIGWWAHYAHENAELAADRAAVRGMGPGSLAGALFCLGSENSPSGTAAFVGAAELRVAQVLREPLPPRRPALSICLSSAAGLLLSAATLFCTIAIIQHPV